MKLRTAIFIAGLFFVTGIGFAATDIGNGFSIENRVFTGIQVVSEADGDDDVDDTTVHARNDGEGAAARAQFNINYDNGNFGAKFRVRADLGNGPEIKLQYGYAWQHLFNKHLTLWEGYFAAATEIYGNGKAGIPVLDTESGECDRTFPQIKLEVKPIDGLSFGVMIPIRGANQEVSEFFRSLTFGAYYTSDIFRVVGEIGLKPEVTSKHAKTEYYNGSNWVQINPESYTKAESRIEANFGIGATFTPVQVSVTGKYASNPKASSDYADNGGNGFFAIAPKVVYTAGALEIYGQSVLGFSNEKKKDIKDIDKGSLWGDAFKGKNDPDLQADDKVTAVNFELGGSYAINDTFRPYLAFGSDRVNYFAGNGVFLKPGVKIKLGPNMNLDIWDKINRLGAEDWKDAGTGKSYSSFQNTLQIDVSFNL
jgi:hypothetical protein